MTTLLPFFKGVGLGASLIIAIGAQNAYVLSHGLRKQYAFTIALTCAICDAVLISLGIAGVGTLIASNPTLTKIAAWGGAAFLGWYGAVSFRSAFRNHTLEASKEPDSTKGVKKIVITTLAISLLNPHVYLDTLILLGSIGGQFPKDERFLFGGGAIVASFLWFFLLSYGAGWLSPLFKRPITWKIMDFLIGCIMWSIAVTLVLFGINEMSISP